MKDLKKKLDEIASSEQKYPPKSEMHKAAVYMLNEWKGLENIFTRGEYHLDNNTEIMQRHISMSRRNSLFFGSHKGAERAAIYYSLACSCKLNKKNFFRYMSDVMNKASLIPDGLPASAYRHLLPDVWVDSTPENKQYPITKSDNSGGGRNAAVCRFAADVDLESLTVKAFRIASMRSSRASPVWVCCSLTCVALLTAYCIQSRRGCLMLTSDFIRLENGSKQRLVARGQVNNSLIVMTFWNRLL